MSLFSGRKSKIFLAVLVMNGIFLFLIGSKTAQAYHATSSYDKLFTDTLTSQNWNDLFSDFVNTWLPVSLNGPVGIATSSPSSGLEVNGTIRGNSLFSSGNVGFGTNDPLARLEVVPTSGYSILAGNFKIGNVALPTADSDAATKGYVDSFVASATSSMSTLWGGLIGGNIWNLNSGNVGIGNISPSQGLDIGTTMAGLNAQINSTLSAEMAPALTGSSGTNWTLSNVAGYDQPFNNSINKSGDGVGTITTSAATNIVAGHTYQVTITVSAISGSTAFITLGGNSGSYLTTTGTFTENIRAASTAKLIIYPVATGLRMTITSISIKEVFVATSGILKVNGNLEIGGAIRAMNGTTDAILINRDGNVAIGASEVTNTKFVVNGGQSFTGGTSINTGMVVNGYNYTNAVTTEAQLFNNRILTSVSATAVAPEKSSPYLGFSANAWNTTPTAASKVNIMGIRVRGINGPVTSGALVVENNTVDGVANTNEIARFTSGGNVGIGTTSPVARLEIVPASGYSILAGNFKIGNVALPTVDSDAATKGYVDSFVASYVASGVVSSALYVGITPTAYTGDNNGSAGYTTAQNACKAAYASSSVCTPDNILGSISAGITLAAEDVWIFAGPPGYTAAANDCEGRSVATTAAYGTYWQIAMPGSGRPQGRGLLMTCNNSLRIACCR